LLTRADTSGEQPVRPSDRVTAARMIERKWVMFSPVTVAASEGSRC
jgi:hypothetical protein